MHDAPEKRQEHEPRRTRVKGEDKAPHAGAVKADLIGREAARANSHVLRHRETTPIARAGVG